MNDFMKQVRNHKTIRLFTEKKIEDEMLDEILETINRTASSVNMQYASIIRVTDPEKKKEISKVCNQSYVADASELLIFIVDAFRNSSIYQEKTKTNPDIKSDIFFQGFTDACLLAQNTNNIIESLGLGGVFLGSILNDAEKIIEILELPEKTFPVLGYGFGYPNSEPMLKPRMDKNLRIFENSYKKFDSYLDSFADYDKELINYYDTRENGKASDPFTDQAIASIDNPIPKREKLIEIARNNGFKL